VKAIVLLTDGDNQIEPGDETHNNSNYTSYSYVNTVIGTERRLSSTATASEGNLDTKLGTLCTNVKQNGTPLDATDDIRLYTITFGSLSDAVQTMMENCSTLDDGERLHYHAFVHVSFRPAAITSTLGACNRDTAAPPTAPSARGPKDGPPPNSTPA